MLNTILFYLGLHNYFVYWLQVAIHSYVFLLYPINDLIFMLYILNLLCDLMARVCLMLAYIGPCGVFAASIVTWLFRVRIIHPYLILAITFAMILALYDSLMSLYQLIFDLYLARVYTIRLYFVNELTLWVKDPCHNVMWAGLWCM